MTQTNDPKLGSKFPKTPEIPTSLGIFWVLGPYISNVNPPFFHVLRFWRGFYKNILWNYSMFYSRPSGPPPHDYGQILEKLWVPHTPLGERVQPLFFRIKTTWAIQSWRTNWYVNPSWDPIVQNASNESKVHTRIEQITVLCLLCTPRCGIIWPGNLMDWAIHL